MPAKATDTETLRARLLRAQQAASPLAKHGRNPHHGYSYAATEDTVAAARGLLHEVGLMAWRRGHQVSDVNTLRVTFEVACPATGEAEQDTLDWPVVVTKGRPADKSMAAALTTAWNYWLIGLLQLPRVDEEVDSRNDTEDSTTSKRAREMPMAGSTAASVEQGADVPLVPFGVNKGQPINEIADRDLEWLTGALAKSVADPDKARWQADNQRLLDACLAEAESRESATDAPEPEPLSMADRLEAGFIMLARENGEDKDELIAELGAKTHPVTGKQIRPKSLTAIHRSADWQNYTWERLRGALMDAKSIDAEALEMELRAEAVPF